MTRRGRIGPDADTLESRRVRLLSEPLNAHDNLGYFLTITAQTRQIIEWVGSECVPPYGPRP